VNKNNSLIGTNISPNQNWNHSNPQTTGHCDFSYQYFVAKNDNIVKLRPVCCREFKTITIQSNTAVFGRTFDPDAFLIKLLFHLLLKARNLEKTL